MEQIQQMLLDPELEVVDALNLDGGSSSQLFVAATVSPSDKELLYSGGDLVPVGLVVTRKPK
jgi:exopolysaccharide biosynthesis protein